MVSLSLPFPQFLHALLFLTLDVAVEKNRFSVPFRLLFQCLQFPSVFSLVSFVTVGLCGAVLLRCEAGPV